LALGATELGSKTSGRKEVGLYYVREPWKPSAPGKTRILSALLQESKTYSNIKSEAQLQDPSLIKYLRELLREGLIEKDPKTRAYSISPAGKNYLIIDKLAASVNSLTSASTIREESLFSFDPLLTRVGDYQRLIVFAGPDERKFKRRIQEVIEPFVKDNLVLYDSEMSRSNVRKRLAE
jgi:predicted transcriptional regulator